MKNCAGKHWKTLSILQRKTLEVKILHVCNMLRQMANYNALFYDDIYFHFQQGIPFIKNAVLSRFLLTTL